ncbi:MAG: NAD(P) transhydrogenase subunit alpha, partial [Deltaproteobacteria bacterium]|nr:NAD(P) transhydrogenase subunit alpha [Deltaproteobacteria bacterium]
MTTELEIGLYVFMLAGFLGYHIITRVPPLLHTPLMSATNAIAGISLVGSLVVAGADYGTFSTILGFIAVTCSSTNVVGGFLITDRMLKMFKTAKDQAAQRHRFQFDPKMLLALPVLVVGGLVVMYSYEQLSEDPGHCRRDVLATHALKYFYILSAALFILGLKGLSSPRYARKGMFAAELGMLMAVAGTLFHHEIVTYKWIIIGIFIGSVI